MTRSDLDLDSCMTLVHVDVRVRDFLLLAVYPPTEEGLMATLYSLYFANIKSDFRVIFTSITPFINKIKEICSFRPFNHSLSALQKIVRKQLSTLTYI